MARQHDPEKIKLEIFYHDRDSGKLIEKEMIAAPNQFQALLKIYKLSLRFDSKKHYIVVKCDGSKVRPTFLIKNLRRYGIEVVEPEKYPSGEEGITFNRIKEFQA
jgi:hypothetical protein